MHARRFIEDEPEAIRAALAARNHDFDLDALLGQLGRRRELRVELEELQARRNAGSKQVGELFKSGQREEGQALREELAALGDKLNSLDATVKELEGEIDAQLMGLPNLLAPDVPRGADESDNRVLRSWGEPPSFDFEPRDHHSLGEDLDLFDFERGAKITGARFSVLKGQAARMNRALMAFMLDRAGAKGYAEVVPPFIVNSDSLTGTGQLPKFADDLFRLARPDNYFLCPTAEVPVTNLHRDEILGAEELPLLYTAYTPCFRSEAGSYGKDTRGLIRQHQFEKVELVQLVRPEESEAAHEALTGHAEEILQLLELPYRTVSLCSGDLGFGAWKCYDIEVWLPAQDTYREISSCSNFRDFQARRANIRFRPEAGAKPQYVHTLNGSGLAIGRTLVAIFENHQLEDGRITVPEALRPYLGGLEVIGSPRVV
ncbi:MAG: serine--tRNA ligase [Myxococcota bacterium]|nr:serine--tRNA ligase [Myxococcota bacterium]